MTWTEIGTTSFHLPYVIYLGARGCDAWIYSEKSLCLGRELSRADAKAKCVEHAKKEARAAGGSDDQPR